MRPLAIVTTWNRFDLTQRMLESLAPESPNLDIAIVDNGSAPAMQSWLQGWASEHGAELLLLDENIGCPRALNLALCEFRRLGQAVVKLDNDVLLPPAWVLDLERLVDVWWLQGRPLAMVSAYYTPWEQQRVRATETYDHRTAFHIWPVVGHAVFHTGDFVDAVGYFDVLAADHLYGFEDLLMSHKANVLGWETLAWEGWCITNLQRHGAMDRQQRDTHVAAMRPLYNARVTGIRSGGSLHTGPDGQPAEREAVCAC
jgi:hypothetical protein